MKELAKEHEVRFETLVTVLAYVYSGKVRQLPKGVCVCVDEECDHVACRPVVDFMVERHLLDIIDKAAADDILVVLSVANTCSNACERLLARCIEIVGNSNVDFATLDKVLPENIVKQIMDSRLELGLVGSENSNYPNKHVKKIHRALDSDVVELVRMLLKEGLTILDDA